MQQLLASRYHYPLTGNIYNTENIIFIPATPRPIEGIEQTPLKFICSLLADDDYDFPLLDYNFNTNTWLTKHNLIKNNCLYWHNATHSPSTVIRLFRQMGWEITFLLWEPMAESIEGDND